MVVVAVHEGSFGPTVPVQVHKAHDRVLLMKLFCELFDRCDLWEKTRLDLLPSSVQVDSTQAAAVVSVLHAVNVDHRYHLKNEISP